MAKIRRVVISPEAFFHIMANDTAWRVSKGIPKDAKLRGFTIDPYANVLNLFVEHDSFEELTSGDVALVLETEFRRIP